MTTPTTKSEGLQELELRDELKSADISVNHWEAELAARIDQASSLDGVGGWVSKLLGRYDADVDAAVQEVQAARLQLHQARERAERSREALDAFLEQQARAADDAVSHWMVVEEAVAAARAAGGAVAEALGPIEARMALVEARRQRLHDAHESCLDLVMELTRARSAATQSRPHTVTRFYGLSRNQYATTVVKTEAQEGDYREVEIASVTEVAMAWEDAVLALGADTPPLVDLAMEALLQVDGLFRDPGESELKTMAAQTATEPIVRRVKTVLDAVSAELVAIQRERAALVGMELPDAPR